MKELIPIELAIGGGMWDSGDGAKSPDATTRRQSNLIKRASSLVKRKALRFEQTLSTFASSSDYIDLAIGGFGVRKEGGVSYLDFAFSDEDQHVRTYERASGSWSSVIDYSPTDFEYLGAGKLGLVPWRTSILMFNNQIPVCSYNSIDGASYGFLDQSPSRIPYFGSCNHMAIYYQRLMMAGIGVPDMAIEGKFDAPAGWTNSNITVNTTTTTVNMYGYKRHQLEVTGATPSTTFDIIDRTGVPFETVTLPVVASVDFYVDKSGPNGIPVTLEVLKHDGTVTYDSKEYILPSSSENQHWQNYRVSATIPASTNFKVRVKLYNSTGTAAVGDKVTIVDTSTNGGRTHIPYVQNGHNFYHNPNFYYGLGSWAGPWAPADYTSIAIWSEIGEAKWLSTGFYKALEEPGEITGLHSLETKLLIAKENALWWFGYSTDPDIAIQLEGYTKGVGASARDGVATYKGRVMCVNKNGLYAIAAGSPPELLIHEGMLKKMFKDNTPPRMLCVDEIEGILYIASTTKLWAMELSSGALSEVDLPADVSIGAMHWGKYDTDTEHVLRIAYLYPIGGGVYNINIAAFSGNGNKDNASGSDEDVDSVYIFHTIQTPPPMSSMKVHFLEVDHEITSSSVNDVFSLDISYDDGVTWTSLGDWNISQVSTSADTQVLSFPVNKTFKRALFRITHSGRGGEAAFNFNGARLLVSPLGRAQRPAAPTAV